MRVDRTMVKFMKKSTTSPRLNLRLPSELVTWAKEHAKKNHTTMTQLIVNYLRELQKRDTDVPQI